MSKIVVSTPVSLVNNFSLSSNAHNSNWQVLGECKISLEPGMDAEIQAWLKEVLHSLCLSADFLSGILISVQDSARRAFQARSEMKFEHIHLRVFVSKDHVSMKRPGASFESKRWEHQPQIHSDTIIRLNSICIRRASDSTIGIDRIPNYVADRQPRYQCI
jgi:hypothetical protein